MIALALLAAAALSPQSAQDIRCVAVLGIVAYDQRRESTEWADLPAVGRDGERFAGIVGERTMTETGRSREAVKDLILADVATLQKSKTIPRAEVEACMKRMAIVAPPPLPPTLPRCAAVMTLAAEAVKKREGLSKGAKDLATIASVLAYRARVEGAGAGKSEAQVAEQIAAERATASKAGGVDDDQLQGCAELAAAE
jgi:alkylhydroperoxidase/carboxymuconolactone decarboxylase family protein YurZ